MQKTKLKSLNRNSYSIAVSFRFLCKLYRPINNLIIKLIKKKVFAKSFMSAKYLIY